MIDPVERHPTLGFPLDLKLQALDLAVGTTHKLADNIKNVALIRGTGCDERVIRLVLDKRAYWLNWYTMNQSKWMDSISRRPGRNCRTDKPGNRSRHYADANKTRDQYVRCHDGEGSR